MIAGLDEKARGAALTQLKRFADPAAMANGYLAMVSRMKAGEYKRALPADATPEAVAAWRSEHGIPAAATDYGYTLPEGVTIDQLPPDGKARLDYFNAEFHKLNLPADQAKAIVGAYNARITAEAEAQAASDAQLADSTQDALIADWGRDMRANLKMNAAHLDQHLGKDFTDLLMEARLPDGRKLMNTPEMAKYLNGRARAEGGDIIVGTDDGGAAGSVDAQIEAIVKVMQTDINKYYAEGLDKKYTQLLEIQERRGKLPNPHPQG